MALRAWQSAVTAVCLSRPGAIINDSSHRMVHRRAHFIKNSGFVCTDAAGDTEQQSE